MRILVFSDSHSDVATCASVIDRLPHSDIIVHAGDCFADAHKLESMYPRLEFRYVAGNCDSPLLRQDLTFEAEGKKFFLSHGHRYAVKTESDFRSISQKAEAEGADAVIFGHTHESYCKTNNGLLLLNPGSIKYGRTFGIIEIEDGKLSADVCGADLWI